MKLILKKLYKSILNRIKADDMYKDLYREIAKFEVPDYLGIVKALNVKFIGKHEERIRKKASKEQLRQIRYCEVIMAYLCNRGFLKNSDEVIKCIEEF